jgi:hypothetical protein
MRSLCTKSILPAAVALVLAATGGSAYADPAAGLAAIEAKLQPAFIPTLKASTLATKAKASDLLIAISLALADTALSPADIAAGALLEEGGKVRADKDKIAGQIIATVVAARNLANDAAALGAVADAVFNVNSGSSNAKSRLSATGQAAAVVGAIKAAGSQAVGVQVGSAIADSFSGDVATLLGNTIKALGKTTTAAQADVFAGFVNGTFTQKTALATKDFVRSVADKVAASNPAASGALFGGLVDNNPGGIYTNTASDTDLLDLLSTAVGDAKLSKALGEIIGQSAGGYADKNGLTQALNTGRAVTTQALITQGILRAGTAADVSGILSQTAIASLDPTKFGATLVTGTGQDTAKVDAIVDVLATKVGSDAKKQTAFGIAVINAVALSNPAAAEVAARSIFDAAFPNAGDRVLFGTNVVGKLKVFAAAGYVAKAIINDDASIDTAGEAAGVAAQLMAKGTKAATDIAQQVSALAVTGSDKAAFATVLANSAPKQVQNVAMGISITDPHSAGNITRNAINHSPASDKTALAKAAAIGSAVANVVDEEAIADIARGITDITSDKGTATGRPVKTTIMGALATGLAKALQSKPGVKTIDRMDELGELAAALTNGLLGHSGDDKTQTKLLATVGSNILKALSKTPVLSANPNGNANPLLVAKTQTLKADLWEARDIAGSIAQTIKTSTVLTAGQIAALLGTSNDTTATQGPLLVAFLKLAGKKGSATYQAVLDAFAAVRAGNGNVFEVGNDPFDETDNRNG